MKIKQAKDIKAGDYIVLNSGHYIVYTRSTLPDDSVVFGLDLNRHDPMISHKVYEPEEEVSVVYEWPEHP